MTALNTFNASTHHTGQQFGPPRPAGTWLTSVISESLRREAPLTIFALLLWLAMIPTLLAWGLDERLFREVNVWVKPLKFMASLGLFAWTSAWFVGLLPENQRRAWPVRAAVWMLIAAALLELGYITWQAAHAEASHYNLSTPLHAWLYTVMGMVALGLTTSQALLAWHIGRHAKPELPRVWRNAVVWGLWMTFALGTLSGFALGALQPPAGSGLPIFGWHFSGGDLRPAHFVGLHAQQLIPLAGFLLARQAWAKPGNMLAALSAAYMAVWCAAMAMGFM